MPNQHKNPMLAFHPDDGSLGDWARAEAKRRGVGLKVILEEALKAARDGAKQDADPDPRLIFTLNLGEQWPVPANPDSPS